MSRPDRQFVCDVLTIVVVCLVVGATVVMTGTITTSTALAMLTSAVVLGLASLWLGRKL